LTSTFSNIQDPERSSRYRSGYKVGRGLALSSTRRRESPETRNLFLGSSSSDAERIVTAIPEGGKMAENKGETE
jgi:hypothetical protein